MKFEEWLAQQDGVIEVDCGCVTTEAFYHWMRVAYESGNSLAQSDCYPVQNQGWIPVSERMPEKNQDVLISVNFDSDLVQPLVCSARYTGSTFRRGDATVKPGSGVEQATHWMPLPAGPKEQDNV